MMEFQFEQSPWEAYLDACKEGTVIPGWKLLSLMEEEEEEALEDAFRMIQEKEMILDLSGLPRTISSERAALRLKQEREYAEAGMDPSKMEENDPLRLYLEEIAGIPACGDETLLAAGLLKGDENAAQQLTNLGLSRVVQMAAEYAGWNVLLLNLILVPCGP